MLTQLESKILAVISQYIHARNMAPTIAEIAKSLNINSRGTVHRYVQSLIKKGALERVGTGWRGLRLVPGYEGGPASNPAIKIEADVTESPHSDTSLSGIAMSGAAALWVETMKIPLLGRIAAGVPIEAIPDEQHLDLAAFLIGPDRYALRVSGDSMIDAGILDGDTVILRKADSAKTGDIVVALIDNQEATLKRLGKVADGLTELIPENSQMPLMLYSSKRVSIQGVLVGQMRNY